MALAQLFKTLLFAGFAGLSTAACGAPVAEVESANDTQSSASNGEVAMTNSSAAISERFPTLDAYLAWLRDTQAPVDGPWYREVRPGVFVLQTGGNLKLDGGNPPEQTFTREELERKFGFRK